MRTWYPGEETLEVAPHCPEGLRGQGNGDNRECLRLMGNMAASWVWAGATAAEGRRCSFAPVSGLSPRSPGRGVLPLQVLMDPVSPGLWSWKCSPQLT